MLSNVYIDQFLSGGVAYYRIYGKENSRCPTKSGRQIEYSIYGYYVIPYHVYINIIFFVTVQEGGI